MVDLAQAAELLYDFHVSKKKFRDTTDLPKLKADAVDALCLPHDGAPSEFEKCKDNDAFFKKIDAFLSHFDVLETHVAIDPDMARAAFDPNEGTSKGQVALVTAYGEEAAKAEAARWKTKLGFVGAGVNPDGKQPKKDEDDVVTVLNSRNPWSPKMVFKNAEARREAQIRIIKGSGKFGGAAFATKLAAAAGVTLAGTPLYPSRQPKAS